MKTPNERSPTNSTAWAISALVGCSIIGFTAFHFAAPGFEVASEKDLGKVTEVTYLTQARGPDSTVILTERGALTVTGLLPTIKGESVTLRQLHNGTQLFCVTDTRCTRVVRFTPPKDEQQ